MFGKCKTGLYTVGIIVVAIATLAITALLINISQHKAEAKVQFEKVVEIGKTETDPAVWGLNFPLQYESFMRTSQMRPTLYAGSEKGDVLPPMKGYPDGFQITKRPAQLDPRWNILNAGNILPPHFFRETRGHYYALDEAKTLLRQWESLPVAGVCLNCHSSKGYAGGLIAEYGKKWKEQNVKDGKLKDGTVYNKSDEDAGYENIGLMPKEDVLKILDKDHGFSCIQCHDPKTMKLRVVNKAFINGIKEAKAAQGIMNFDVNKDATHKEMRSFVCGQCHVEYYFKAPTMQLTFGWNKGFKFSNMYDYYKTIDNTIMDKYKHEIAGSDLYLGRHPTFEVYNQSIHAENNVACADCHMPYERSGAKKFTNHQIQSPLFNINSACMGCHKSSEKEMKNRVEKIQDRFTQTADKAADALVRLVNAIAKVKDDPSFPADRLKAAQEHHGRADFFYQMIITDGSTGFHAPDYSQQVLADSLDESGKGLAILNGADPETMKSSEKTLERLKEIQERDKKREADKALN
ncbi:hypothetical protein A4G19_04370 [Pasteurellaceae bacterium Macca]|nr:hypothetical protein [Pasteurellaceae bacterium Macca]